MTCIMEDYYVRFPVLYRNNIYKYYYYVNPILLVLTIAILFKYWLIEVWFIVYIILLLLDIILYKILSEVKIDSFKSNCLEIFLIILFCSHVAQTTYGFHILLFQSNQTPIIYYLTFLVTYGAINIIFVIVFIFYKLISDASSKNLIDDDVLKLEQEVARLQNDNDVKTAELERLSTEWTYRPDGPDVKKLSTEFYQNAERQSNCYLSS